MPLSWNLMKWGFFRYRTGTAIVSRVLAGTPCSWNGKLGSSEITYETHIKWYLVQLVLVQGTLWYSSGTAIVARVHAGTRWRFNREKIFPPFWSSHMPFERTFCEVLFGTGLVQPLCLGYTGYSFVVSFLPLKKMTSRQKKMFVFWKRILLFWKSKLRGTLWYTFGTAIVDGVLAGTVCSWWFNREVSQLNFWSTISPEIQRWRPHQTYMAR